MTPSVTVSRLLAALAAAGTIGALAAMAAGSWANVAICVLYVALACYAARVNARTMAAERDRRRARQLAQARAYLERA